MTCAIHPFAPSILTLDVDMAVSRTRQAGNPSDRVKVGRRMTSKPTLPDFRRKTLEVTFAGDRARLHALFPGRPNLDAAYPFATA